MYWSSDVCSSCLIAQAVGLLGPAAKVVQPLFIPINPARDTAQRLSEWLAAVHPRFVGLTGPERAVAAATKAFKVVYEKVETENGYDYAVAHPGLIYIIDRDGHFLFLLPPGTQIGRPSCRDRVCRYV